MSNVREIDTDMMVFGVRTAIDSLEDLAAKHGTGHSLVAYVDDLVTASNKLDRIIRAVELSRVHETTK